MSRACSVPATSLTPRRSSAAGAFSVRSTRVASARRMRLEVSAEKVCIVNTNGGGHAVMGFYLAKELATKGHDVTIMTVGEADSKKMQKTPFTRFGELTAMGVKTVWGEPTNMAAATGDSYDVVVDNNGKDMDNVGPVADWARNTGAKQFLFVSSAGMYKPSTVVPVLEGAPIKESAGHAQVESYLAGLSTAGVQFSSFRPQYMVGSGNNKDCEEYFFDRLVRGRPIYIPGSGEQVTNIAHAGDNAHMIALAVGNEKAHGQIFNCVRDQGVTLDGLVELCAAAAGVEPKIVHYDPEAIGIKAKKAFPFRTEYHFFTAPMKAMVLLNWRPAGSLESDIRERFAEYKASPRFFDPLEGKFAMDDEIASKLA